MNKYWATLIRWRLCNSRHPGFQRKATGHDRGGRGGRGQEPIKHQENIPDNIPKFESRMDSAAHKLFWQKMKFKNQRYNIKSDPFFSMFKKQILLNNRHTVNFDKYPIKNKKFNDL